MDGDIDAPADLAFVGVSQVDDDIEVEESKREENVSHLIETSLMKRKKIKKKEIRESQN